MRQLLFFFFILSPFIFALYQPPKPKKGTFPFDSKGNYIEKWADNEEILPENLATSKEFEKPKQDYNPQWKNLRKYNVKRGDTLYAISRRFNVSVQEIQKINHLSGTLIRTNQKLLIPRGKKK